MKFISYALATALSISTTSPVVAGEVDVNVDVKLNVTVPCQTIVEIAAGDDRFKTLVAAVTAADLVGALSGDGPALTVFAPTETAFAKLPAGTVDDLLLPENKAKLTGLLAYHAIDGKVISDDLKNGEVPTGNGADVTVDVTDGVKINNAKVIEADIEACNGVLHVIDAVLIPSRDVGIFYPGGFNPFNLNPPEPETSSPTDTLNSKSGKSTVAKASKASSTSAKAGKSDTDKMKTSPSAKAVKSDTDKMKTTPSAKADKSDTDKMKTSPSAKAGKSDTDKMKTTPSAKAGKSDTDKMKTASAKAEKASTPTTTSAKAAKGADESDVPEEPEEPKAEDESDKAEEEEEEEKEEEEQLSIWEAAAQILQILYGDEHRKLSSHLRG